MDGAEVLRHPGGRTEWGFAGYRGTEPRGCTTVQSGALTSPDVQAAGFGAPQEPHHHTPLVLRLFYLFSPRAIPRSETADQSSASRAAVGGIDRLRLVAHTCPPLYPEETALQGYPNQMNSDH